MDEGESGPAGLEHKGQNKQALFVADRSKQRRDGPAAPSCPSSASGRGAQQSSSRSTRPPDEYWFWTQPENLSIWIRSGMVDVEFVIRGVTGEEEEEGEGVEEEEEEEEEEVMKLVGVEVLHEEEEEGLFSSSSLTRARQEPALPLHVTLLLLLHRHKLRPRGSWTIENPAHFKKRVGGSIPGSSCLPETLNPQIPPLPTSVPPVCE
ncbi:unnamed protein product [Pleuronectes platessa]|uniref:Uncharacterized protein n=1 Tax=Pleuronectes platessa TaxID=8262 RepID=A0A9N7VNX1_PLEPL|nr:unnamed protein product [Pleuronectes platessa]